MRARIAAAALGAGLASALAIPACAGAAASPSLVLAALNAERAANGLPAGVAEVPEWSAGCALHNDYRAANGGAVVGHDEVTGRPGYTAEGDHAGNSAVLAATSWSQGNPFATAPLHLTRLMDPRLARAGVDDRDGMTCLSLIDGIGPPGPADAVYTVPGDGRTGVPPYEVARELPFVPGDLLGLPGGAQTGPNLLVLADGPFAREDATRLVDVTLRGPDGPVGVRWVDDADPRVAPYLPPGGIAVPLAPLAPGALYRASATVLGAEGVSISRAWSFRTAGAAPRADARPGRAENPALTGRAALTARVRGRRLVLASPSVLAGRKARLRVTLRGATRQMSVRLVPRLRVMLRPAEARSDRTRIAVHVPGFAAGGVRWQAATLRTSVGRARAG